MSIEVQKQSKQSVSLQKSTFESDVLTSDPVLLQYISFKCLLCLP